MGSLIHFAIAVPINPHLWSYARFSMGAAEMAWVTTPMRPHGSSWCERFILQRRHHHDETVFVHSPTVENLSPTLLLGHIGGELVGPVIVVESLSFGRHPSLVVHELSTLDRLVGHVGVGFRADGEVSVEQICEAVEIAHRMCHDEHPTYAGEFYQINDARNLPRPKTPGGLSLWVIVPGSWGKREREVLSHVGPYLSGIVVEGSATPTFHFDQDNLTLWSRDITADAEGVFRLRPL